MENSALIISCQHGDLKSFTELYKIYSKNALGTAYLIAGSKGIAEDIVQETFIECWKSFQRLQNPATFEVWFYKILVRTGWRMVKRYNLTIPMNDDSLDGVVESVRTVFVLDKNEQVVEKSSDQVFITPAVTLNTELSDTALSTENIKFTTTTTTHINDLDATWKGLSYPNYPNDMTQKPDGIITTHILMWSKDSATYIILPLGNSNLSMQAVVSQAEAFMNAQ